LFDAFRAEGSSDSLSKKEEALSKLNDEELLDLARSVSENSVGSDASRKNLIKMVKGSLSVEEIKQKVNEKKSSLKMKTPRDRASIMGAVGQAFLIVYGIVSYLVFFFSVYNPVYYPLSPTYFQTNAILGMTSAVFFFVFTILNFSSMIASRQRLLGNRLGIVNGLTGVVASIFGVVYYLAMFFGLTYQIVEISPGSFQTSFTLLGNLLPVVYTLLISSTMILIGVFFLLYRKQISDSELTLVTGIIYIFAGSYGVSLSSIVSYYYVYIIEPPLFIMAGAFGLACFLARKLVQ
jgi:hypothetical protein